LKPEFIGVKYTPMLNIVVRLYIPTVVIAFILAYLWEFTFEPKIDVIGETAEEKWEFVFTSVAFVILALIVPTWIKIRRDLERKETEERLRESEYYLNEAQSITHIGHWKLNPKTKKVFGSDELFKIFDLSRDEASLEAFVEVVHPEDREFDLYHINRGLEHGEDWDIEHRLLLKNGIEKTINAIGRVIKDENGNIVELVGTVHDITEKKKKEEELKKKQNQLQAIIDGTQAVIYLKDIEGKYLLINKQYEKFFHVRHEDIIGKTDFDIFPKEMAEVFQANDRKVLESKTPLEMEEVVPHDDRPHTYISLKFLLCRSDNEPYGICGISTDITERKEMEEKIGTLSNALEYSSAHAVITDMEGNIEYVNPTFSKQTGYNMSDVIGKNPRILKSGETPQETYKDLWKAIKSGNEWKGEFCNKKKNGEFYWEQASISPIINDRGEITKFIAVKQDITEKKTVEEDLLRFSYEDGLTGIANRRTFDKVINREWGRALRANSPISLIMLDIDHFKAYNDHYGHQQGDTCLKKIANQLKKEIRRSSDFVARYGGEEFSVVLPFTDSNDASKVAEKIRKSIEAQKIPHEKSETGRVITISAGSATLKPGKGLSSEMLIKQADGCLYAAKKEGRNRVENLSI